MAACETNITCIAQVTFKLVNKALLVHNRRLKICLICEKCRYLDLHCSNARLLFMGSCWWRKRFPYLNTSSGGWRTPRQMSRSRYFVVRHCNQVTNLSNCKHKTYVTSQCHLHRLHLKIQYKEVSFNVSFLVSTGELAIVGK